MDSVKEEALLIDSESTMPFAPPEYHLEQLLYSSANSLIYRAKHQQDNKPVILKILKPHYPKPEELGRFVHEYEIIHSLNTKQVITAYGLEPYRSTLSLILEDCGGISLDHWLAQWSCAGTAAFPIPQFLYIASQIVEGLAQIHTAGIIHKNINPSNIVFNPNTQVLKLIDFGLATTLNREAPVLKSVHVLEGTLAYLSPEQTGRMNRMVDFRSDFYSLGATLYELLTGKKPFDTTDVMDLVYCHLAKTPTPPHNLNPAIPPVLSNIILKLMAKAPEDRYQSARGIQHDLDICLHQWQANGSLTDFQLGKGDQLKRFIIPEKLYGRAAEVETLLAAFDRAANGAAELMLVTGFSGIGKTAVINEVHKPIIHKRGFYIKGKFDQFNRNLPFSAFFQAFRDLMNQLLSESDVQLQQWRSKILAAVGENGQIIIDVIPELEQIIGVQPPPPALSGTSAQNRFNVLLQKFLTAFTDAEHPLVIFLDDMQWADRASLDLLINIMIEASAGYLLLLGAYRNNEVSSTHPLQLTLNEIKKSNATINTITLAPLQKSDIEQLTADTLSCSVETALPLSELVYQKAKGNPFFSRQFLKAVYEEGLITFDENAGYWQYDLEKINALALNDDVIAFMATQLQKLPQETQEILKLSACIGSQFDLETLAMFNKQSPAKAVADLWPAVQTGLILPQNEAYKFYGRTRGYHDSTSLSNAEMETPVYRFLHDRVQQAAYSLIPQNQLQSTHLQIGQLLLKNLPETEREERIFEIVNQYNRGIELLTDSTKRWELAHLNLKAGQKAKDSTAFLAAWEYFSAGRQLLPENCWQREYQFTLELHEALVESAYLSGNFAAMEELADIVFKEAHTIFDKIKVYTVKIEALNAQNKLVEAVNTGMQVLALLGVEFPKQPGLDDISLALQETCLVYSGREIAGLINLPEMSDPVQLAVMRILSSLLPSAFLTNNALYTLLVLKQVVISILHGNTPASAFGYASYGLLLCGIAEDVDTGSQFGQLALELVHRLDAKAWQCKVVAVVHSFITHWKNSVKDTLTPLLSAYYSGVETGDFQYAGYSGILYCKYAFLCGIEKELSELQHETISLADSIYRMKQMTTHHYFEMLLQALHEMREGKTSYKYLKGKYYDEEKMLPTLMQAKDWNGIYYANFHKMILNYLFGDYELAVEASSQMAPYNINARSFPYEPVFCLYDSLARLALNSEPPEILLSRVEANQEKLRKWAQNAPMNCNHKIDLIEAERQRLFGSKSEAIDHYDRAIAGAKENSYYREEALANELAAKFYLEWGKAKIAQIYMRAAHAGYLRWGASAKAAQLERLYPDLLASAADKHVHQPIPFGEKETAGISGGIPLDLITVIKASQAMSAEIELDRLLEQMMRIALENAGAQRGALILERNGEWVIEALAEADNEITVLQALDLRKSAVVSADIVYAVALTRNSIVLDDAAHRGDFIHDAYINRRGVKSVMCTPLVNQGQLHGVLYLENNLTTYAFPVERLELLNLLSAQMALSLNNARLYKQAQEEIAERKLAEAALQESEQRFRNIFNSVNDAILVLDEVSGNILDVNETMSIMYGFTRQEALGLSLGDLSSNFPPYTQTDALNWLKKTVAEGPQLFEWMAKDRLDRLFWVEVNMRLTNISGHKRVLVVVRDITERKQVEEALEKRIVALTQPLDSAEDIAFEDILNLEDIQHLQDLFADTFGVAALITRPDGQPITQPSKFTDFCGKIIRKTEKGERNCNFSDAKIGKHNLSGPNIQPCLSAGLCNAGVSITVGGRHIANWLIGQVRNENQDEEEIMKYGRELGVDETAFRAAYRRVPVMPQEQFDKIAHFLFFLANQVSTSAYQNIQQARFISERKHAEAALFESEQKYRNLHESLRDGFAYTTMDGVIQDSNATYQAMVGYTSEELHQLTYMDLTPEKWHDFECNIVENEVLIHGFSPVYEKEYRRKDGVIFPVELRTFLIKNAAGDPQGMWAIVRDITERKRAEAALQQANLVVENSPVVLFQWKPLKGWPVELVSKNVIQFGYTPEELLSGAIPYASIIHPDDIERVSREVSENSEKGIDRFQQEYRLINRDGKVRWVDDRAAIERDAYGNILRLQGIVIDITERKQAEEALRQAHEKLEDRVKERTAQLEISNKELEAFTYTVSHDLRAPLRSMDSFSRILMDEYAPQLPKEAQRYLHLVRESTKKMSCLIDDLLAFSRLNRQSLNKQLVSMKELVEQTLVTLEGEYNHRKIDIKMGDLPNCAGDEAMLRQVWVNLFANALKFTRERENAKIEIGAWRTDDENVYFIKDNGAGFDMQYANKLFGVFQRLHSEREFEGTGVGLAIVQRVIQRHGGRVWAEGQVDEGAAFYFSLPCGAETTDG